MREPEEKYHEFFNCTLHHRGHLGGILTKDSSLASIVNTTNMRAVSLSFDSLWNACNLRIEDSIPSKHCKFKCDPARAGT